MGGLDFKEKDIDIIKLGKRRRKWGKINFLGNLKIEMSGAYSKTMITSLYKIYKFYAD